MLSLYHLLDTIACGEIGGGDIPRYFNYCLRGSRLAVTDTGDLHPSHTFFLAERALLLRGGSDMPYFSQPPFSRHGFMAQLWPLKSVWHLLGASESDVLLCLKNKWNPETTLIPMKEWMDKEMQSMRTMEYYTALNKEGNTIIGYNMVNLKGILLGEISQTQKDKSCIIPVIFLWNI